jgi:hypothetical protein
MREITIYGSTGQGGNITKESAIERQTKRVIESAEVMFLSNGLWPLNELQREEYTSIPFDSLKAESLRREIEKLKNLL